MFIGPTYVYLGAFLNRKSSLRSNAKWFRDYTSTFARTMSPLWSLHFLTLSPTRLVQPNLSPPSELSWSTSTSNSTTTTSTRFDNEHTMTMKLIQSREGRVTTMGLKVLMLYSLMHEKFSILRPENTHLLHKGKYLCTADILFDWLGFSCFGIPNLIEICKFGWIQTSQIGGHPYGYTSPY